MTEQVVSYTVPVEHTDAREHRRVIAEGVNNIDRAFVHPAQYSSIFYDAQSSGSWAYTATSRAKVPFDTVNLDPNSWADLANNRITVSTRGVYICTALILWDNIAGTGYFDIKVNNTTTIAFEPIIGSTTGNQGATISGIIGLEPGDYVEAGFQFSVNMTLPLWLYESCHLDVYKISQDPTQL